MSSNTWPRSCTWLVKLRLASGAVDSERVLWFLFLFSELEAIALGRIGSGIVTPAWKGSEINDPLCAVCLRGIFSCSFH